jgi:fibronectin-binding autotransporter adhesin
VTLGIGNLTVNQSTTTSFAGSIGGTGGLTKSGAGTLILTGASSYTGITGVSGGTLELGPGGSLASGTPLFVTGGIFDLENGGQTVGSLSGTGGGVNLGNGSLTVNQATTTSFAGTIGGAGGLTLEGGGTLALSNAGNSYAGGTTVTGGSTLNIAADGALGAPSGGLTLGDATTSGTLATTADLSSARGITLAAGGGSFDVASGTTTTLSGIIGGAGGLTKTDSGTLVLAAAETYAGGTEIDAGTLRLGSGGSLAPTGILAMTGGTFDLNNNSQTLAGLRGTAGTIALGSGNLTIDQPGETVFAGAISGTGGLTKAGAGILGLTGAESYTGGTSVNAGTLTLGPGGSLAAAGALTVNGGTFDLENGGQTVSALSGTGGGITLGNGNLTVNQSITTSFIGSISGTGGLTKQGGGTLILDGVNSYTGLTSVDAGTLEIGDADHTTASLTGPVTVGADGNLAGHGTIGGDVANNSGGIVSPGGSIGTLTVNGNYVQGPSSTLVIEVSPTAASQLHVLGSASLAGNLDMVYEPGVYRQASYDILQAGSITGTFATVTGNTPTGFDQSLAYSSTGVALAVDPTGGPVIVAPTNDTIFTALSTAALLAAQQANGALLTHMGELHLGTGSPKVQTALASATPTQVAFTGTADQLADLLPEIPQAVGQMGGWFKAIGSFASLDGSISTPGFDTQAGGFLAGFDKAVSANFTAGIAAGYLHTNLSEAGGASGSLDTPRLAVYGTYTLGNFAVDATAGYAYDFIDSSRPFASLGQTASSSYNSQEANAALQVSTRANFTGITFMPAAGLAFVHFAQNGVGESGAPGFNLNVNGNSANSLRPFIGLTAAKSYTTDGGTGSRRRPTSPTATRPSPPPRPASSRWAAAASRSPG